MTLAEVETGLDIVKLATQIGSAGVLAWLVWWIFAKQIPTENARRDQMLGLFMSQLDQQRREHRDERTEERKAYIEALNRNTDATDRLNRNVEKLVADDVRGRVGGTGG